MIQPRGARFSWVTSIVGGDPTAYRNSLVALVVAIVASLVAGITLATTTDTLEELPGLLLLVPAALAVKGNIFGALGSRLGTSIHAGVFQLSPRLDTVVGQNTAAALVLSLVVSVELALLAKGVAVVFDITPTMSTADFITVSALGGATASLVVLVITLLLAGGSVRFGWDLDNVVAPLVTATGDVVTLPALMWAAALADIGGVTTTVALVSTAVSVPAAVWAICSPRPILRSIMRESLPILTVAGVLDLIAGVTIEKRLDDFVDYPVLLILLPGFLGTAGTLGGVLSSRLATKVHLGLISPGALPRTGGERSLDGGVAVSTRVCDFGGRCRTGWSDCRSGKPRTLADRGCLDTRRPTRHVRSDGRGLLHDHRGHQVWPRPRHIRHSDSDVVARLRWRVHSDSRPRRRGRCMIS